MTTADPLGPPIPPSPASGGPTTDAFPRLRRSGTDRMLGGVCGGLAEYSGIDPLLWRVGAVALTLMGPGVIIYLLLWVFMTPPPGVTEADQSPVDRAVTRLHDRLAGRRVGAA